MNLDYKIFKRTSPKSILTQVQGSPPERCTSSHRNCRVGFSGELCSIEIIKWLWSVSCEMKVLGLPGLRSLWLQLPRSLACLYSHLLYSWVGKLVTSDWIKCVAHCVDLTLKGFLLLSWVMKTLKGKKNSQKYTVNCSLVSASHPFC